MRTGAERFRAGDLACRWTRNLRVIRLVPGCDSGCNRNMAAGNPRGLVSGGVKAAFAPALVAKPTPKPGGAGITPTPLLPRACYNSAGPPRLLNYATKRSNGDDCKSTFRERSCSNCPFLSRRVCLRLDHLNPEHVAVLTPQYCAVAQPLLAVSGGGSRTAPTAWINCPAMIS